MAKQGAGSLEIKAGLSRMEKSALMVLSAFFVLSLARGGLLLSYPSEFAELSVPDVLRAWRDGLRFDAVVVARIFGIPLLLMNLPGRWFSYRPWFDSLAWLCYVLLMGLTLLLASDLLYFREVERHVSYEVSALAHDSQFVVKAMSAYGWQMVAFVSTAAVTFFAWRRLLRVPSGRRRFEAFSFPVIFLLIVVGARGGTGGRVVEIIDAYSDGRMAYGNLALNGVFTGMVFALNLEQVSHHFVDSKAALIDAIGPDSVGHRYPMERRMAASSGRPNIVFVLLESWNYQHVDSFGGNGYGVTPNFDALARQGLRFTRFFSAGQRSIEGIQATLTGIPPLRGLPRIDAGVGISSFTRLGAVAKERGYSTLFVQSSDRDSFKVQGIAAAAGFDNYFGREDIPLRLAYPDPDASSFGWDYETLQFTKERLDHASQPFIAYVFTGTTHVPYAPLPGDGQAHSSFGEDGYLATLRYADWSIGEFMRGARTAPWFDNTVFIFTADHTNGFQKGDFRERFHTPFLIYSPGRIAAGTVSEIGSQLDVLPTSLDLMGSDAPYSALGNSLLRPGPRTAFFNADGTAIGLVTEHGYIVHNLTRRLMAVPTDASVAVDFNAMERHLLALDQVSYELLRANRWAR